MGTDITGFWGDNKNMDEQADNFTEGGTKTLPPGWHKATMLSTELTTTTEGEGMNLFVTFSFAGIEKRKCFNLKKKDGAINEYTRPELAKLAVCAGVKGTLSNPMMLHGLKVSCKLTVEEKELDGKQIKVNEIVNYHTPGKAGTKAGTGGSPFGQEQNAPQESKPAENAPW